MSHSLDDRCFYCMSADDLHNAQRGEQHPTILMDSPLADCPRVDPKDFEPSDGEA